MEVPGAMVEFEFLAWLAERNRRSIRADDSVLVDIGDDGAVLKLASTTQVVVSDSIAEGTHFDLALHSLGQVGRKALAVNLSDIAAMGCEPDFAIVNFQLPRSFGIADAIELYEGLDKLASEFEMRIVGGDTNCWEGKLVVGVTVLGHVVGQRAWTMSRAEPGDVILVSGEFGGSLGGRHLSFTPRLDIVRRLAPFNLIHAATDVSDSLGLDLGRLLAASACGAEIDLKSIPLSAEIVGQRNEPSADERQIRHGLCDGEDFELLLTVGAAEWDTLSASPDLSAGLTPIGIVTTDTRIVSQDGLPIELRGYQH